MTPKEILKIGCGKELCPEVRDERERWFVSQPTYLRTPKHKSLKVGRCHSYF